MAGNAADERYRRLDFNHSPEMLRTFNNTFGHHEFRGNQREAINATILNENVFVVGDNGAGKSLCYQLPACLSAGVTVVISPLLSLILDQIQKLTELGIVATTLSGGQGRSEDRIYQQLSKKDPKIKLLYVTPEKIKMSRRLINALKSLLYRGLLARFAIDEAQCISQYDSKNFREAFEKLNDLRMDFPGVPMIAVSGPVRDCIQEDILKQLQMTNPQVFTMILNRTNLKYAVLNRSDNWEKDCYTWIKKHCPRDSGIVYCWTREDCDSLAGILRDRGLLAYSYHSRKTDKAREIVQTKWNENKCMVICATAESFGMGIDKPDVRYVIHTFLPRQ